MAPARTMACSGLMLALFADAQPVSADDLPTFADRPDEPVRDVDREFAVFLNPLAMTLGLYGGEADLVLGRYAAVAVEGALYRRGDTIGEALGAGLLVYPLGGALRGPYVEPRVADAHPGSVAQLDRSADVVGLGATAGWQFTWDYGFSVRVGGGAMYFFGGSQVDASNGSLAVGPQIVLDGSLGWAF
ncbi:MAG TPA: hypothetical protein VN894_08810 [Polyangiaceae bacterium]|nr:hypothetical protein [Polyangiaceae bacterium]